MQPLVVWVGTEGDLLPVLGVPGLPLVAPLARDLCSVNLDCPVLLRIIRSHCFGTFPAEKYGVSYLYVMRFDVAFVIFISLLSFF